MSVKGPAISQTVKNMKLQSNNDEILHLKKNSIFNIS
jgi:hypothetical protein